MARYHIGELIAFLEGQSKDKMIHEVQMRLDSGASRRRIPVDERDSLRQYERSLKGLLYWLNSGCAPMGLEWLDFVIFRPLCEGLIERGELRPAAITIFEKSKP